MGAATIGAAQRGKRPRDRKQQIIRAAATLFHQRGYDAVGVSDVAAAVGITGSALYRHFHSKQDLLQAVIAEAFADLGQAVERDHEQTGAPGPALIALLTDLAAGAVNRPEFGALWQRESRHLADDDRQRATKQLRTAAQAAAARIVQAHPRIDESTADMLAWAMMSGGASLSYHRSPLPPARLERILLDIDASILNTPPKRRAGRRAGPVDRAERTGIPPRASRHEALLSAAAELFDQHGFHAVSMEDIGAAVGLAPASVYRHFPGKSDLLYAALVRSGEVLHMSVTRALTANTRPADALAEIVRSYVEHTTEHVALGGVHIRELGNLPDDQRAAAIRAQQDYVAEWVRLTMDTRGDLTSAEAKVLAHAAFSIIGNTARTPHLRARPNIVDELVELTLRVLNSPLSA